MRSTSTELLCAALMLSLLVPLSGCTEAAKARFEANQMKFQRKQAEKMLEERASEYWAFARWHSFDETAAYFEKSEDQRTHLKEGTDMDAAKLPKIDAVEVQFVFVDPDTRRTGEVRVRWQQFMPGTSKVEEATETQRWYRRSGQWWLAPASGIPDDEYDDLGDAEREIVEDVPNLETVVPDSSAER
ncbi:MAG: hypothetical protein KDA24_13735 [Deltaproteobacteria bacterium]|nr:hypothetical protein [Deltaproteobacteria bacterium]